MAIIQTSKIMMRRGPELELPGAPISLTPLAFAPGLDIAEIGFATDSGRLFIGHAPGVGQANFKRPNFPYQNIEILTEASVDTIRKFFNFMHRDVAAGAHYTATLLPVDDWQDVAAERTIGAAVPFVFPGDEVIASVDYFVVAEQTDLNGLKRTPLRQGTLRILSVPNEDEAEVSDDAASVRRLDVSTPLALDGSFTAGDISFRVVRVSEIGDHHFKLQCLCDLGSPVRLFFTVDRPLSSAVTPFESAISLDDSDVIRQINGLEGPNVSITADRIDVGTAWPVPAQANASIQDVLLGFRTTLSAQQAAQTAQQVTLDAYQQVLQIQQATQTAQQTSLNLKQPLYPATTYLQAPGQSVPAFHTDLVANTTTHDLRLSAIGFQTSMRQTDGSDRLVLRYVGNVNPAEQPQSFAQPAGAPISDDGSWMMRGNALHLSTDNGFVAPRLGHVTTLVADPSATGLKRVGGFTIDDLRGGYILGDVIPVSFTVETMNPPVPRPIRPATGTIGVKFDNASGTYIPDVTTCIVTDAGSGYPSNPSYITVRATGPSTGFREAGPTLVLNRQISGRGDDSTGTLAFRSLDDAGFAREQGQILARTIDPRAASYRTGLVFKGTDRTDEFTMDRGLYGPGRVSKGQGSLNFGSAYLDTVHCKQQRLEASQDAGSCFVDRRILSLSGITTWATIGRITPQNILGTQTIGRIRATISGNTLTVGAGCRESVWYFSAINGTLSSGIGAADVILSPSTGASGGGSPQFRVTVDTANQCYLIQVCSSDGVNILREGGISLDVFVPGSTSTWAVTYTI